MKKGKVYLIGAGPGDIGLLTIKGLRCLQKAEVVVYDFHLNAQMLNYISHEAEFIYAGKRGGHHAMTQDEINQALIEKAKEGKIVCRLKGGDPFVFGRGGEEAEVLVNEGIEFEIIPGVSSSIAAPAYAGIPLTHRKYSSSFAVITGNEDITKPESSIDWTKFANSFDTLVFLMGVKNISAITSRLIDHGKSPDTPTAVVRWGTRPDQKTVVSNLKDIAGLVKEENIKPPAVMVVGNVVKLRDKLKWYENKPLFGQRILITREYTKDYEPLEDLGAEVFEFPTIEIVPPESYKELDESIDKIETYNWIIFTSINGFKYFMQRLLDKNRDIRDLRGIKICAIGTKTAEAIRNYGVKVDIIPEEFNAEGLIKAFSLQTSDFNLKGLKILLPRAEVAREVFPEKVRELGGEIDTPTAYRAIKPEKHGKRLKRFLKEGRISIATFTSAATFNNFIEIIGEDAIEILKDVTIAVIGPVTAKAIEKAGLKVSIMPKEATIRAMVDKIIQWVTKTSS
ncbi:uroporphyrinogen III methyltransferase [Dissulfurispira thermophila]|uniref:uroporphyrinogen-III C-methyltransferase n=1 Tax=Dissulfurispira thermophila TaxID=2715679 RepID=A0A7G1H119_9BACT|nr:uroporphyrinogen-III C-methyltransferase [Dissulfurispira thermophila]BCB95969.1 uroporphyrinogen III methyltransferase [Dissulfurispira thermophila]